MKTKSKPVRYKLILPKNFKKEPLLGRNAWLKALRSGKFRQTTGKLCAHGGRNFCCLGVKSKIDGFLKKSKHDGYLDCEDENGCLSRLNPSYKYLKDIGVFPLFVKVEMQKKDTQSIQVDDLATCNDEGLNFNQIANIIERVWCELKVKKSKKK